MWTNIKKHQRWLIPLILLLLYAPWSGMIDLKVTDTFYHSNEVGDNRFVNTDLTWFTYYYAPDAAWIALALSGIVFLLSYFYPFWRCWRRAIFVPFLVMLVGSGLVVHGLLKDHWGRPRPRQVEQFGGEQVFRPFYVPEFSNPTPSKSFACGHCSVGFFFFAYALMGERMRRRGLETAGYILAFALGGLLGWCRIAQGAHFLSDVIVSALIMWWTSLIVCWLVFPKKEELCTA